MRFLIVTGMSGAGKSTALKLLEDIGFFCADNIPPVLITKFADVCIKRQQEVDKVAFGIDIRGGNLFNDLFTCLDELNDAGFSYEILFLDCDVETLVKRYKETRRVHPLAGKGSIMMGVALEEEMLKEVKAKSDYIVDTSNILARQLREELVRIFVDHEKFENLMITVMSFGYKYGIPVEADLVFDVRFIENPYYHHELRPFTGNDKQIYEFVMNKKESLVFLDKAIDMLEFLIPCYITEGKSQLVIAIGCTGGKHRSVTISNEICNRLSKDGHSANINHRDIEKDAKQGK